jgi:hypothetical protein
MKGMVWLPHTGHVSNFCGSVGPLIEPVDVRCFRAIRAHRGRLSRVGAQGGRPGWTRLELAGELKVTSGRRNPDGIGNRWATTQALGFEAARSRAINEERERNAIHSAIFGHLQRLELRPASPDGGRTGYSTRSIL